MKSTFKVLFYLKKGSEKKNGEVMIMAAIVSSLKSVYSLYLILCSLQYILYSSGIFSSSGAMKWKVGLK